MQNRSWTGNRRILRNALFSLMYRFEGSNKTFIVPWKPHTVNNAIKIERSRSNKMRIGFPVSPMWVWDPCFLVKRAGVRKAAERSAKLNIRLSDQANKSTGWMPGHQTPKKDAISCDKPWWAANRLWPMDVRMRKLSTGNAVLPHDESIVMRGKPGELKHLSTRRKRNQPRFP